MLEILGDFTRGSALLSQGNFASSKVRAEFNSMETRFTPVIHKLAYSVKTCFFSPEQTPVPHSVF